MNKNDITELRNKLQAAQVTGLTTQECPANWSSLLHSVCLRAPQQLVAGVLIKLEMSQMDSVCYLI